MPPSHEISVGARDSLLSKKQVAEVLKELKGIFPSVVFLPSYVETVGDCDKKTSLRMLGKTDFFTREIDHLLLTGECRIGIHSAKDLPEPLPKGLVVAALTKGIDPSDSLVTQSKIALAPTVATSSVRRENSVRELFPNAVCVDIRGTIQERLAKLFNGEVDGVVVAEAALIRLELTHLNRIRLPGETAPLQGRLAVVVREDDLQMRDLFRVLHHA